ncbi:hypothetical protein BU23DRAFT_603078 [Bimuria novae-zelandiae CBS 107.79]|uniref:Uncharacterized protein n=1 Tax=Bimuria novae-zelandiae CBS 107.79 TaxID=1447943 RepID=A0A6A5UW04_9PLEO|nr:hypothetical protein BU23DRAFT_603078 [Bimuria novae-zelandiae CBS 107.79]
MSHQPPSPRSLARPCSDHTNFPSPESCLVCRYHVDRASWRADVELDSLQADETTRLLSTFSLTGTPEQRSQRNSFLVTGSPSLNISPDAPYSSSSSESSSSSDSDSDSNSKSKSNTKANTKSKRNANRVIPPLSPLLLPQPLRPLLMLQPMLHPPPLHRRKHVPPRRRALLRFADPLPQPGLLPVFDGGREAAETAELPGCEVGVFVCGGCGLWGWDYGVGCLGGGGEEVGDWMW